MGTDECGDPLRPREGVAEQEITDSTISGHPLRCGQDRWRVHHLGWATYVQRIEGPSGAGPRETENEVGEVEVREISTPHLFGLDRSAVSTRVPWTGSLASVLLDSRTRLSVFIG